MERAHKDCPSCRCWSAEEGEELTVFVNGVPVREGEPRQVRPGDVITYTSVRADDGRKGSQP